MEQGGGRSPGRTGRGVWRNKGKFGSENPKLSWALSGSATCEGEMGVVLKQRLGVCSGKQNLSQKESWSVCRGLSSEQLEEEPGEGGWDGERSGTVPSEPASAEPVVLRKFIRS